MLEAGWAKTCFFLKKRRTRGKKQKKERKEIEEREERNRKSTAAMGWFHRPQKIRK